MSGPRRRFIDAHVHLWDRDANPWYRFVRSGPDQASAPSPLPYPMRHLWDDHLKATSSVYLAKWVHVTAAASASDVDAELAWVEEQARQSGRPFALIGRVDPALPLTELSAAINRQARNRGFRGIRLMGEVDYASPHMDELFSLLAARRLVFDVLVRTEGIGDATRALARHPDLIAVLEHVGWPLACDEAHFREWRQEVAEFAALPNTFCKLSGLGMTVRRNDPDLFRLFFDECIALFGAERCMFATNFPVDLSFGPAEELFAIFAEVAAGHDEAAADCLYAATADGVYFA